MLKSRILIASIQKKIDRVASDKLLNNIFWNSLARFGSAGLNVLTTLFLMSVLEVEDYGEYVVFFSIYSTIPFFFDFGLNNSFVSMGARFKSLNSPDYEKLISTILCVKLIILSAVVSLMLIGLISNVIDQQIIIIILLGAVLGLWEFLLTVFKSDQNFKLLSRLLPIRNVIAFGAVLLAYYFFGLRSWSGYLTIIMVVPVLLTLTIYLHYFRRISLGIDTGMLRRTFSASKWIALFTIVTALHARADIYLLEYFTTDGSISGKETGIFSAAFSLLSFINLVTSTFAEAVLPKVSQESNYSYFVQLIQRLKRTIPYVFSIAVLLGLILYFLFRFGFGGKYLESIDCMIFIGAGMVFLFYLHTLNTMFYPLGRTDLVFKVILIMFAVNITLGCILIPVWGSVGAAVTNMTVSIVGLVITVFTLKRTLLLFRWKA